MKNDWPADHQNVWKNPDQWGVEVKPKSKPNKPDLVVSLLWIAITVLAAIFFCIVLFM